MASARALSRPLRQRAIFCKFPTRRHYAENPSSKSANPSPPSSLHPGLVGGIIGGGVVLASCYAWYHFSGTKATVQSLSQGKEYVQHAVQRLKEQAPEPNEALEWLRRTTLTYAAWIPGGREYVKGAFDDIDKIRQKHGDEVDRIVKEMYSDMQNITKEGMSLESAQKAWDVIQRSMGKIVALGGDSWKDIMDNHPDFRERLDKNVEYLKTLAAQIGPEAQKQFDQTREQFDKIMSKGLDSNNINEARQLIESKLEVFRKQAQDAWQKGMEKAKPYLDQNPQIKKLVEQNADKLKQGQFGELWQKVQEAASSGNLTELEKFVKSQLGSSPLGQDFKKSVDETFQNISGGGEILTKLQKMQEESGKKGKQAEDILHSAIHEIKEVLSRKLGELEKIANQGKE